MMVGMTSYGIFGFIGGFILGMMVNAYLLRGTPREAFLNDKRLRQRYGLLNWGIALFGMIVSLAIGQTGN